MMRRSCLVGIAIRSRQWFADQSPLDWHFHTFPIRLEQRSPAEIVVHKNCRVWKFGDPVAGFRYRTVGVGCSLVQPRQGRHLAAALEHASGRSQMIGDGAWPKSELV